MSSIYQVIIVVQGREVPLYFTKDGKWIAQGRDAEGINTEKSNVHRAITYAAMIEEMDINVGAIIDAL